MFKPFENLKKVPHPEKIAYGLSTEQWPQKPEACQEILRRQSFQLTFIELIYSVHILTTYIVP